MLKCPHGIKDPSIDDCHNCSLTNYGRNCQNVKLPLINEFTKFFSGLSFLEDDNDE